MTDQVTIAALSEALDDEFKARATYRKVIERFGPVRPFVNIVEAENRHIDALLAQFERLGVRPPADRWADRAMAPETLATACAAAVQAEIDNDELYKRLLEQVSDAKVRFVMRRLQQASRLRHLPAFRRCLDRYASEAGSPHQMERPRN